MNALVPARHSLVEENEVYANQGEVVKLKIPKRPSVERDGAGDLYVALPRSVLGGSVHIQLYGLLGRDLEGARERYVFAAIHGVVTCAYTDGKQSTHIGLVYAKDAAPTHRLMIYGKPKHFKRSVWTVFDYAVPGTGGVIEIQKL